MTTGVVLPTGVQLCIYGQQQRASEGQVCQESLANISAAKTKVPNILEPPLLSEYVKTMKHLLEQICTHVCTYTHDCIHFLKFIDGGI